MIDKYDYTEQATVRAEEAEAKQYALEDVIQQLEKENTELKQQLVNNEKKYEEHNIHCGNLYEANQQLESKLASIKYLNREEVEKIVFDEMKTDYNFYGVKEAITAICSLTLPVIDKDKIVKVLMRTVDAGKYRDVGKGIGEYKEYSAEEIATEIIKEINE